MELNYVAILVASVTQFIVGAIWYTALGKIWGQIHGFDKLPKDVQQKMMKEMGPLYGTQFLVTIATSTVLSILLMNIPSDWSAYKLAILVWLGFLLPAHISGVIFGGTEGKWIMKKILIQAGASLLCLVVGVATLGFFM